MAASTGRRRIGNLPGELTTFVDRRAERTDIKRLMRQSRLITVVGVGGVGKTRLALRLGDELRRAFPDGVWFVDLTTQQEEDLLAPTIAYELGLREASRTPATEALTDYLTGRHLLLILDNCEHVIAPIARLTNTLLRSCPRLRVLATSRESLRIAGEVVFTVPPLSVPAHRGDGENHLAPSGAMELFAKRATAVNAGFQVDPGNYGAVAELCRRLDGLPLAIELAAVHMRAFNPEQILEGVVDMNHVLAGGSRAAPDRHQSLHGSIEWSYRLCSPEEQLLWRRAATFRGSFDLAAAHAVCGHESTSLTLQLIASLVDKSIVTTTLDRGTARYRMLATIRDYGWRKIDTDEERATLRHRHATWYRDLVDHAMADWIGPEQVTWLNRLRAENPNLRAALEYWLETDDSGPALTMATKLFSYWVVCGLFAEGRHWLEAALDRNPNPGLDRRRALLSLLWLVSLQGDSETVRRRVTEMRRITQGTADPAMSALTNHARGTEALFSGRPQDAILRFESALTILRSSSELSLHLTTLAGLGLAHAVSGNRQAAAACYEECLSLTRPRGESWYASQTLWSLAIATWQAGDAQRAAALAVDSLRLRQLLDDPSGMAWCLETLAWIAAEKTPTDAARLLGAANSIWETSAPTTLAAVRGLLTLHQQCEHRLRIALGEARLKAEIDKARNVNLPDTIAWALGAPAAARPSSSTQDREPTVLTRREYEVATLVAAGKTNKEIAATLVIAQRTAEAHVDHILRKLGFTSRTQIAAWLPRQEDEPNSDS